MSGFCLVAIRPAGMKEGPDRTQNLPTPCVHLRKRAVPGPQEQGSQNLQSTRLLKHIKRPPITQCGNRSSEPMVEPRPSVKTGGVPRLIDHALHECGECGDVVFKGHGVLRGNDWRSVSSVDGATLAIERQILVFGGDRSEWRFVIDESNALGRMYKKQRVIGVRQLSEIGCEHRSACRPTSIRPIATHSRNVSHCNRPTQHRRPD